MKIRSIALGICVFALSVLNVHAGTLIVTTTADGGPGSLRDTIAAANAGDTIQFDPTLNGQAIALTSAELWINKDLIIDGPGANLLTVRRSTEGGTSNFRIFTITPNHTVTIDGITISNGSAHGSASGDLGGGIYNDGSMLTITNTIITGNSAGFGGGIFNNAVNYRSAYLMISTSTFRSNSATTSGGAIYSYGLGDSSPNSAFATVELDDSTVSDNSATWGGGIFSAGYNGGWTILAIVNSTISSNAASQTGGGIYNLSFYPTFAWVFVHNSTIGENSANDGGGAIMNDADEESFNVAEVQIGNTILKTGAAGENIRNNGFGRISSNGYNLSDDDGSGFLNATGDQIDTDPMLGPLNDNGGPTLTHGLLADSPAINAGDPSFTPPPDFDQRGPGFPRVLDGNIDIGSVEGKTTAPAITKLLNISTRLRVLTDDNALIGGFIVTGTEPKSVIVRAIGPSLTNFGVPDALADPALELHGPGGFSTITNNNWRDTQEVEIEATGLAPSDNLESAIVAMLPPGAYTAIVRGNNNGIGVGLVEAYDLESAADARLANISTRGFVDTGDNVMIGGFILGNGSSTAMVLIRAIGPSLTAFGVPDALADPTLELHDSNGALIATNNDWRDTQEAEIKATGIPPSDDLESAVLETLAPGAYTAIVRGTNNSTGVALIEAYQLDSAAAKQAGKIEMHHLLRKLLPELSPRTKF